MASLRDIKKRIRSVNNSQKITKAMKLVAASKLKRAQDAIDQARPYADAISELVARTAARALSEAAGRPEDVHPLLVRRPAGRTALVVVSSDRGSCGAFNSNVLRHAERFLDEHKERLGTVELWTVGKKAREHFAKRPGFAAQDVADIYKDYQFGRAQTLAAQLMERFGAGTLDGAFVIYNEAKSAMAQVVRVAEVLPAAPVPPAGPAEPATKPAKATNTPRAATADAGVDALYAPSRAVLLDRLIPAWVSVQLNRAILESVAAEHGARMTAMEAATKNAQDLVESLTLQYNRVRQAAITTELMDIIGGAEALAG